MLAALLCSNLPVCSKRLSLVFIKTFIIHLFNTGFLTLVGVSFLNVHINPLKYIGKIISQVVSVNFFLNAGVLTMLQMGMSIFTLRLLNFKPLVFVRNIDKVVHLFSRPLALSMLPLLSMSQSIVLYTLLMGAMPHFNTCCFLCLLTGAFALPFTAKLHFTDYGYSNIKFLTTYKYAYNYPYELFANNMYFYGQLTLGFFFIVALYGRILELIGFERMVIYLFQPDLMLVDKLISFPVLVISTVLPQLWAKMFLYLLKKWINEPEAVKGCSHEITQMEQLIFVEQKSCVYYTKRSALETLSFLLSKSLPCRVEIFKVCYRTNDSKLWSELLTEILQNVTEMTKSLKKFRFLMKKREIAAQAEDDVFVQTSSINQTFQPGLSEIQALNGTLRSSRKYSTGREQRSNVTQQAGVGDVGPSHANTSMSFYAQKVANPFNEWDSMHAQQRLSQASSGRQTQSSSANSQVSNPNTYPSVVDSFGSWFQSTTVVHYLFEENEQALVASQFDNGSIVAISLELLKLLLDRGIEEDKHGLVLRDLSQVLTEVAKLWDAIEQVNALGISAVPSSERACCVAALRRCLYFMCDMYNPCSNKAIDVSEDTRSLLIHFIKTESRNKL